MLHFRISAALVLALLLVGVVGCKPDYPSCNKDGHCHEGEYCVNNICQQCRDIGDCPEGQECTGGGCRDIPGYCTDSADCAEGQICRDMRCGPCLTGSDCAEGQVCMDGLCGVAECHATEDCPAGLACLGYRCVTDKALAAADGGGECEYEPVYFDFDSADVSSEARRALENNHSCWTKRQGSFTLEGHCDPRGTTEYNMALGERRARMVRKLMTSMGVERSNIKVISKGEEEAVGTHENSWAKDRRVDFE